jgi:hypothetical protein
MSHTANFVLRLRSALINDSRPDHNRHASIDTAEISQETENGIVVSSSECFSSFQPGVTNSERSNAEKYVQYQRRNANK